MKKVFTAESIEEAKKQAAEEFGVAEGEITFNVLKDAKKSLFGKVKEDAEVEAEYEPSKAQIASSYIVSVFEKMGCENVSVEITEIEKGVLLDFSGDGVEESIGRRGEVLDALQYLASLVCNKVDRDYFRIATDCNGFRDRRQAQLEGLARKIAANVKRTGRSTALEPMNPYERRIIHATITDIEGVSSHSKGEDPYRKVIITSNERRPRSKGGYNKRGNQNRQNRNRQKGYDIVSSFEKKYKKPKPEDSLGSGLYTKIDL
ncbi:MAG: protein jag [Ruminococcus sp.]|nr:protein jag [Ruminococcus sp.]